MDGSIPTTADAALEQAFDAAIERGKKEDSAFGVFADDPATPNLGRMLGARLSTADPQAFPQAPEPEQTLSSEEIALDTINRQLENERARCASILKSIFAFRQEYSSRRKTIAALEIAAEKLAEGV